MLQYNKETKEHYSFPAVFFCTKQFLTEAEAKKNRPKKGGKKRTKKTRKGNRKKKNQSKKGRKKEKMRKRRKKGKKRARKMQKKKGRVSITKKVK